MIGTLHLESVQADTDQTKMRWLPVLIPVIPCSFDIQLLSSSDSAQIGQVKSKAKVQPWYKSPPSLRRIDPWDRSSKAKVQLKSRSSYHGRCSETSASPAAGLYERFRSYADEGLSCVCYPAARCPASLTLTILPMYSRMYNRVVVRCFDNCVTGFRSKTLSKSEVTCVEHCADRYIKMTQRVGLRFAEYQALQQQKAAASTGS